MSSSPTRSEAADTAEVMFYHLERQPLETVLPLLIERTLERGWRAVIEAGNAERVDAINALLWTYRADSFIPHGSSADGNSALQPIYLTANNDNPNGAKVRFFVDGAAPSEFSGYDRIVILFDGRDTDAVDAARRQWKSAKSAGCSIAYWQQSSDGRWERKA